MKSEALMEEVEALNEALFHFMWLFKEIKKLTYEKFDPPDGEQYSYVDGVRDMQERLRSLLKQSGV